MQQTGHPKDSWYHTGSKKNQEVLVNSLVHYVSTTSRATGSNWMTKRSERESSCVGSYLLCEIIQPKTVTVNEIHVAYWTFRMVQLILTRPRECHTQAGCRESSNEPAGCESPGYRKNKLVKLLWNCLKRRTNMTVWLWQTLLHKQHLWGMTPTVITDE